MTSQRESPSSDIPSDSGLGTLSIRDKSLVKRQINKFHNNNMSAGYVPVYDESLQKTGIRGKKAYGFWSLIGFVCLVASINLIITLTILNVLSLGLGIKTIEVIPNRRIIKLYGDVDLGRIYKQDGKIEGFRDEPIRIIGDEILMDVGGTGTTAPKVQIKHNESRIKGVDSFNVVDGRTNHSVFSTDFPNFGLPRGVKNINVQLAETNRITSPRDDKLVIKSETTARLVGNEGTVVEGKDIALSADQFIFLKTTNGSIVLVGGDGIFIDVKSIPIVGSGSRSAGMPPTAQYKVCVCMPNGKLFRVPVATTTTASSSSACHHVNLTPLLNPCI